MKYRAKGTFEAIQLKDPLEVANWFARVLPGWNLVELTEHRIAVDKIDPVVHAVHYFDGDRLVLREGSDFPAVMRNDWFQDHYEPTTFHFSTGGIVRNPFGPFQRVGRDAIPKETLESIDKLRKM